MQAIVERALQHGSRDGEKQAPHAVRGAKQLWSELLSLLRQYPGGLTDAVVLTSLCCNTKRHAGASASGAGTLANICRPSGEQQHSAGRTRAVIHSVRSILAQPTRPGVPPAPPTVLLGLQDGSTKHPVTLFLHSRLVHLSQGPALLVHEGAAVRCSSPPTYAAVGAAKRPDAVKLMPSVATVVEVPRDSWAALLTSCRDPSQPLPPPPPAAATMVNAASQQPAPKVPLYDLTQIVLEMVPSLGREHGIVAGWVQAMVQHVCPREHGLSGLGIGSRTLVSRRVMVCGTVEAPAALPEAVARQPRDAPAGGAGGGGAAAAPLIAVPGTTCMLALVDEAVALGDVLNPGDVIALWRPRFRVDPESGPVAELQPDSFVVVQAQAPEDAGAEAGQQPQCQEPGAQAPPAGGSVPFAAAPSASGGGGGSAVGEQGHKKQRRISESGSDVHMKDASGAGAAVAEAMDIDDGGGGGEEDNCKENWQPPNSGAAAASGGSVVAAEKTASQQQQQQQQHACCGVALTDPAAASSVAMIGGGACKPAGCSGLAPPGLTPLASLLPGMEDVAVIASVGSVLRCTLGAGGGGSRVLELTLRDSSCCPPAEAVHAQLEVGAGSKALRIIRPGHTLLLLGASTLPPASGTSGTGMPLSSLPSAVPSPSLKQQQQLVVLTWREGAPNAVLQDLHALPALLHSPALQQRGSLQQLLNTLPSSSAEGADTFGSGGAGTAGPNSSSNRGSTAMLEPLMVPCRVAGVGVRVERVHRVCGRRVEESSLADFFGEACDDDMDVGAPPPATAAPAAGAAAVPAPPTAEAPPLPLSVRADGLWECAFCGVECAGAETVLEFAGCSLTLAPPQAGDDVRSDSIAAGNPAAADAAASGGGGDADIHHKRPLTELPAVGVQAEARAVEALLGMSAEAYCRLGDGQQRALQARIAAGAANTGDDAPTVAAACVADKQSCAAPCAGVRAVVCCCRCDGNREEVASAAPFAGGCAAGPKEAAEMQQAIAAKSFRVTGLARLL